MNRAAALGLLTLNRLPYTALASFCFCTASAACAAVVVILLLLCLLLLLVASVGVACSNAAAFSALRACCDHQKHGVIVRYQ
jgi:hypothetical protein